MVRASPPNFTHSRVISASPRVTMAATALSPNPSPEHAPAAIAMTFLSAPPNSTPNTSCVVYARKLPLLTAFCNDMQSVLSYPARLTEVANPRATSNANDGPDKKHERLCAHAPNVESMSSDIVMSVSFSMPFVAHIIAASRGKCGASPVKTARVTWLGVTMTSKRNPSANACKSVVAASPSGNATSGRKREFAWRRLMSSAVSGS